MNDINHVVLTGRVVRDAEMKGADKTLRSCFSIAVNRRYKNKDTGEYIDRACFVNLTVFGKTAENMGKYLAKGREVIVEGHLVTNTWEKDGKKMSSNDVEVDKLRIPGIVKEEADEGSPDFPPEEK